MFAKQAAIDSWGEALSIDRRNKPFNSKLHCNRATAYAKVLINLRGSLYKYTGGDARVKRTVGVFAFLGITEVMWL